MKRKCENCGERFEAKNKRAKYCSTSCRVSHWQQRKRSEKPMESNFKAFLRCCDKPELIPEDDLSALYCMNCGQVWQKLKK